jgi:uncharacterized protein YjiS (DUF1127 family)
MAGARRRGFRGVLDAIMLQRTGRGDSSQPRFGLRFLIKEGLMTSIKSISQKLAAWRRYRDAVRELSQLSDRELEDIGIRRGDIPFIAASSAQAA